MTDTDLERTPVGFIEEILGMPKGYQWQRDTVAPFAFAGWDLPIVQVSTLAPNEGGKSSWIVSGLSEYWLTLHPKGKVDITTKDQKQLNEQIIPALEAQHPKLGFKSVRSPYYRATNGEGGRIIAYVTDDAGRVEGSHGAPDAPLLKIIDEAKSVDDRIFTGIDRCGYQGLLLVSSGGLMQGNFYQSHTKHRDKYICIKAGLKDCPHISKDKVQRIIDKYGINHPFTRSSVFGEFMEQDDEVSFVISHSSIMAARENPPKHFHGHTIGFIDFAEGTAEHVLAVRDGNKTVIALAFRESNKHAACARLIRGFTQNGLKEDQVWGDAADKESLDILASLGWNIHRQNFGAPAKNKEVYQSWSAEAWHETASAIAKGEVIIPEDEILISQLVSRYKTIVGRGKLGVEEKYDMRKRGVESPDRADAFCGCQTVYSTAMVMPTPFSFPDGWATEHDERESHRGVLEEIGAWAGS